MWRRHCKPRSTRSTRCPSEPEFIIHTGDLSHTSKAAEFDTLDQVLKGAKPKQVFYVPGEHDTSMDDGKQYLERYGKEHQRPRLVQLQSQGRPFRRDWPTSGAWKGMGTLGDGSTRSGWKAI